MSTISLNKTNSSVRKRKVFQYLEHLKILTKTESITAFLIMWHFNSNFQPHCVTELSTEWKILFFFFCCMSKVIDDINVAFLFIQLRSFNYTAILNIHNIQLMILTNDFEYKTYLN